MPEPDREALDVEQALAVLDTYNRQVEALARQLGFLEALHREAVRAREALEGLRKETSAEILVPLGANTFIRAEATGKATVITGIGSNLSVEKSWAEAEERLSTREGELKEEMSRLSEAIVRLQQEAAALQEEIEADVQRLREGGG